MVPKLVIVDFDGTLTDVGEEAKPFRRPFYRAVSKFLNVKLNAASHGLIDLLERRLNPEVDLWVMAGLAVAPATVDPYLRCTRVARLMAERFRPDIPAAELEAALSQCFKENYPKSGICFH